MISIPIGGVTKL